MITIPTTELIGGIQDVLPIITDEKSSLAGIKVAWDGESLHFTAYDVRSGGTVRWTPGEGAEGEIDEENEEDEDIDWGGDDAPWATWIWLPAAKEILKLFKLPAKLWRVPVTLKCALSGDRLIIERTDSPRGERLLIVPGDPDQLKHIPAIRQIAERAKYELVERGGATFANFRLGAFGAVRPHGDLSMYFDDNNEPVGIEIGTRYAGFIYQSGAKNVRPYSLLRDGAGVVTSNA